jgi:hypothetical protein
MFPCPVCPHASHDVIQDLRTALDFHFGSASCKIQLVVGAFLGESGVPDSLQ